MSHNEYKDIKKFSTDVGISPEKLIEAFEVEKEFHTKILSETSQEKRKELYADVYQKVHKIYGKKERNILTDPNPKNISVKLFRKELENKSVLDVGCGEGFFLASIANQFETEKLCGIDTSIAETSFQHPKIKFIQKNIVDFKLEEKFDVVISDQVWEHIAPADIPEFINSLKNALNENSTLILLVPNKLFGPSDVTRIFDYSCTGKIESRGTHLNETTYSELIPFLEKEGFSNFRTLLPLPKVKQWVPKFRINPKFLILFEKSKLLMSLIYKLKFRGFPLLKTDVIIICKKN